MPDKIYGFQSEDDIRRIRECVKWSEVHRGAYHGPPVSQSRHVCDNPVTWGKAVADWDPASPNVIRVQPCMSEGTQYRGCREFSVYIALPPPASAADPANPARVDIAEGDVVAYLPLWLAEAQKLYGLLVGGEAYVYRVGQLFPVTLTQVSGAQGSAAAAATWTYDVTDSITAEALGSNVDPTASPHLHQRPTVGQMKKATAGLAYYRADRTLVLATVNEQADQEAC